MKKMFFLMGFVILSLVTVTQCGNVGKQDEAPSQDAARAQTSNDNSEGNSMDNQLIARMVTNKGEIVISLEFEKTPLTVCNFVGLAEGKIENDAKPLGEPYYDGLLFHRVIPNFMIQGGDPKGNGTGGPGYKFADEFDASLKHDKPGILSMANAGPTTNGSQFFITHGPTPHLDGKHTVFGHVVEGQDVVNSIQKGDMIKSLTFERIGEAAEAFVADQAMFDELKITARDRAEAKQAQEQAAAIAKMKEENKAMIEEIMAKYPDAVEAPEGYYYVVNEEGSGESPTPGTPVKAHYAGTLLDGTEFDNSFKRGAPIEFPVGGGRVIPGWDYAFLAMKKGDKRTLILPPALAYGERRMGPIPANSWLIFEVELVDF